MSGLSALAVAVLLGGGFATGVLSLLAGLPRWRAASLASRIAPYVRDVVDDEVLPRDAFTRPGTLPAGGFRLGARGAKTLDRLLGGTEALRRRLAQAGSAFDPVAFRGRQLAVIVGGIAAGALAVIVLVVIGRWSLPVGSIPLLAERRPVWGTTCGCRRGCVRERCV